MVKKQKQTQAIKKTALNVVLSFVEVALQQLATASSLNKKEEQQLAKIKRWLDASWDEVKLDSLGRNHRKTIDKMTTQIESVMVQTLKNKSNDLDRVGIYAAMWIMVSMLVDDARMYLPKLPLSWRYLQMTVATWTLWMLRASKTRNQAEETGGELADKVWEIAFPL